jgi:hypothetical protein
MLQVFMVLLVYNLGITDLQPRVTPDLPLDGLFANSLLLAQSPREEKMIIHFIQAFTVPGLFYPNLII